MATPLSPAIHLGADRVVAISVRHQRGRDANSHLNHKGHDQDDISIADIAGVMLDAAFMDALDSDAERLIRINQTLTLIEERGRAENPHRLRSIPLLVIRPSVDLGALAADQFSRLPATLRYLTRGLGASPERGADFLSYLAFDSSYTRPLIEIGRRDALEQRDEIEAFFSLRETSMPASGLDRPALVVA
jgi:NTE family protein